LGAGAALIMNEFFAMGGYGFYVWGSYIVTAVAIAAEIWAVRARIRTARRAIADARDTE
jgi:heme exporter protein D